MYNLLDAFALQIPGAVSELAPIIKKNGLQAINVPKSILEDEKTAIEAYQFITDLGLKWGLMPTPVDFYNVDDKAFQIGLEKMKRWASVAEKIGVKRCYNHVWPGSNDKEYSKNFDWHCIRLGQIQRELEDYGIFYGLEFIGVKKVRDSFKYPFIYTISGIDALTKAAGGVAGFLFDTFHWYCSGGRTDDLYYASEHTHKMVCMHINDAIAGIPRDEQEDMVRAMPMTTGVINSAMVYNMFKENGYIGPVLCEPMYPTIRWFKRMPPEISIAEVANAFARVDTCLN